MSPTDRSADRRAIGQLNDDFCHELDRGNVEGFVALFSEDALYTHGPRVLRGIQQIRQFYIDRTRDGPRTSRHFTQGLRIEFTGTSSARGLSAAFTFSASGSPPIDSTIPAIVADFEDTYAFDGVRWRFAERHIVPLFRAAMPQRALSENLPHVGPAPVSESPRSAK
jgi:ketosteroid isomerase-like protein